MKKSNSATSNLLLFLSLFSSVSVYAEDLEKFECICSAMDDSSESTELGSIGRKERKKKIRHLGGVADCEFGQ